MSNIIELDAHKVLVAREIPPDCELCGKRRPRSGVRECCAEGNRFDLLVHLMKPFDHCKNTAENRELMKRAVIKFCESQRCGAIVTVECDDGTKWVLPINPRV